MKHPDPATPITLQDLAARIGAVVRGDGTITVTHCAGLEEAGPQAVSFVANRKYFKHLAATRAGAVILSAADARSAPPDLALLIAEDPYFAFRQAVVALHGFRRQPGPGVSDRAWVDPSATIGEESSIAPFVYIAAQASLGKRCVVYPHCYIGEGAVLGDDCILYPSVTVYDGSILGNRVILQAGCSIGHDGFGFAPHEGRHHKIPQSGIVVIDDDVEMGADCAVDRATVGTTRIGQGTKTGNLVALGHGTKIGKHNIFVAQVGIAGSTQTGDYVVMAGQVGVANHLKIGDQVQLAAQSGVMGDLAANAQYGGSPALPLVEAKRQVLAAARLPAMVQEFRRLQKRVEELEARLGVETKKNAPPAGE